MPNKDISQQLWYYFAHSNIVVSMSNKVTKLDCLIHAEGAGEVVMSGERAFGMSCEWGGRRRWLMFRCSFPYPQQHSKVPFPTTTSRYYS